MVRKDVLRRTNIKKSLLNKNYILLFTKLSKRKGRGEAKHIKFNLVKKKCGNGSEFKFV